MFNDNGPFFFFSNSLRAREKRIRYSYLLSTYTIFYFLSSLFITITFFRSKT